MSKAGKKLVEAAQSGIGRVHYFIVRPEDGWRPIESFSEAEREKLRPIAETLAMLDGNAFFGMGPDEHYWADQYLPEASAVYDGNGGDNGWASEASFVKRLASPTTGK
jgi:hypothetical protein